jgi:DNA-binding NarL/FixJ family response regulator
VSSRRSRLPLILLLRDQLGLGELGEVEAHAVRTRPVPPRLIARLLREEPLGGDLTARQREVMVLLTSGYSRKEIAKEMGVTEETIKSHLQSVYLKLGVHRQIEAINAFIERAA